jgi:hypothetical protein
VVAFIALSWLVLLVLMWRAYHTLPSAEQLADDRHVRPPLPADLALNVAQSLGVSVLLVSALWPRSARLYILRVAVALIALVAWFLMTVPLDLNTMDWLHRRWLALMILLLLLTLIVYPLLKLGRRRAAQS